MRTLIVGAGALGGYFGARLLAVGRDVTFLVRPATAQRLQEHGLHLISPNGDLHLPPPRTVLATVLAAGLTQRYDLILLSCKAQDLASAIADFTPAVGRQTLILPLLNGMAHLTVLDEAFPPDNVLGGMSRISAVRADDGTIQHLNALDLLAYGHRTHPQDSRLDQVEATLGSAHFKAERRPDILQGMWDKWVTIATAAGSTVLMRASIGDIVEAKAQWLVHALIAETSAIATAAGYPPAQIFLDQIAAWFTQPGSAFTASMLRDLESGAPIEAHQILGDLLDQAKVHQVPAPTLAIAEAHARIHQIRQKREKAE